MFYWLSNATDYFGLSINRWRECITTVLMRRLLDFSVFPELNLTAFQIFQVAN